MLAKISSGATVGLNAICVDVEVDISEGLPCFTIVGLPDKAVEESKDRVRSAIKNSGASFPTTRITVNLAPADLPKIGPAYDLPIAIGILAASGQINPEIGKSMFVGELSLDGSLRHTNGILPMVYLSKQQKYERIFIPVVDKDEASIVSGVKIYAIENLLDLVRFLSETLELTEIKHRDVASLLLQSAAEFDFSEIIGQEHAKRAMEVASAGGHNIFLRGSPGSGKTMISRALPAILPRLTEDEALEVTKIYSITGNLPIGQSVVTTRPFRSPHHTTSRTGLIGGGTNPTPGEVSLAHRGVLFLDEFPEFPRSVLEALRQPMEDGVVTISRARGTVTFPANFLLVAAANPCPCGFFGDPKKPCKCLPGIVARYQKRISGPILDRIDMHVDVPSVETIKLVSAKCEDEIETSKDIQTRVQNARDIQTIRFKDTKIKSNSEMSTKEVKTFCKLSNECNTMMISATSSMHISARSYFKILKIARTIADMDGKQILEVKHIAEALQYRPKELNF